jgi:hypothetical protein
MKFLLLMVKSIMKVFRLTSGSPMP